jgi:hypothetical protein
MEFQQSRDFLTAKKKHLKEMGLGNKPNAAEALEPEDEEELYSCGLHCIFLKHTLLTHLVSV